jgi:hypothetical protein
MRWLPSPCHRVTLSSSSSAMSITIREVAPQTDDYASLLAVAEQLAQARSIPARETYAERSILLGAFTHARCVGFLRFLIYQNTVVVHPANSLTTQEVGGVSGEGHPEGTRALPWPLPYHEGTKARRLRREGRNHQGTKTPRTEIRKQRVLSIAREGVFDQPDQRINGGVGTAAWIQLIDSGHCWLSSYL